MSKTLSGLYDVTADYIIGVTYSGNYITNLKDYLLNVSSSSFVLGTSLTLSIIDLNNYELDISTSFSSFYIKKTGLQNHIDSLVSAGISAGNVDLLYGISIVNLDQKVGNQLRVTNDNRYLQLAYRLVISK